MSNFPKKLAQKIASRKAENALRKLDGPRNLIDFSSNDYLGFATCSKLDEYAQGFLKTGKGNMRNGATGSRLLTGNHELYAKLENHLVKFHNAEAALVFNSGYDANLGFFSSVPQRNDIVLYDELCHASIRDGIKLGLAKSFKFEHNNFGDLQRKLDLAIEKSGQADAVEVYVVTESVFSMDGDSPDLLDLAELCNEKALRLIVDEAHAVGVFNRGRVHEWSLEDKVFAQIITFGKALGCHGAAILGNHELKEYLVNFARSLIYSTALSPHAIGMVLAAYQELQGDHGQKNMSQLRQNTRFFNHEIDKNGLRSCFKKSDSAIQVCQIGGNAKVKAIAGVLIEKGFDVRPILAPTVPKHQERLRFFIHSFNTEEEIKKVLQTLKTSIE